MNIFVLKNFFLWCTVINFVMLLIWFLMIAFAGDWVYKLHGRWYPIARETFNAIHYSGMLIYKLCVFFFNLVPYSALLIIG